MSSAFPPPAPDLANLQALVGANRQPGSTEIMNNAFIPHASAPSNRQPGPARTGDTGLNLQASGQRDGRPTSAESRSGRPIMQNAGRVVGQFGPIGEGTDDFNRRVSSQGNNQRRPAQSNDGEYNLQNLRQVDGQIRPVPVGGNSNRLQMPNQASRETLTRIQSQLFRATQENRQNGGNSETGSYGPDPSHDEAGPSSGRVAAANVMDLTNDAPISARPGSNDVPNIPAAISRMNLTIDDPSEGRRLPSESSMLPSREFQRLFSEAIAACQSLRAMPPTPLSIPSGTANPTEENPPAATCIHLNMMQLQLQQLAFERSQASGVLADQGASCPNGTAVTNGADEQPPQCLQQR